MTKWVLDVGQCNPDHAAIRRMLEQNFKVEVARANELTDALQILHIQPIDLVLINRKLDIDHSDGLEILQRLKSDPNLSAIPVMLITNYPEFQAEAVAAGAVPGFGKDELRSPETLKKLKPFLSPT